MKQLLFILLFCINLLGDSRIIALSPSINEIIFALGLGDKIVANTSYCNYPEASKNIKKIGGYASISLEKVIEARPSVVIAQNYDQKLLSDLKSLGIKTLVFKTDTLASIKNTIKVLGDYFNKQAKAQELIRGIEIGLKSLNGIIKDKKVLFVISPRKSLTNQIYVTGNNLYFEDIIKASQNKNAFFSKSLVQPIVNTEKIIDMNPDIIVLLAPLIEGKIEEQKKLKEAWYELPTNASNKKNIYMVAKHYAGIPSHRVVNFIEDFKEILIDVRNKKLQ